MIPWTAVGWAANGFFFSRVLVQWIASERAGRSVVPIAFWWLSVIGAALLASYTFARGEPILFAGCLVNGSIFLRNLWLVRTGTRLGLTVSALLALGAAAALIAVGVNERSAGWAIEGPWFACALVGQTIWSCRFVVQFWLSERRGRSHLAHEFWWMSLAGNALLLSYAIHLGDSVLVAGYALGPIIQVRNLFAWRGASGKPALEPRREGEAATAESGVGRG